LPSAAFVRATRAEEEVLQDVLFSHPVILNLWPRGICKVDSAYEAIEAMQDGWSDHSSHRRAYHRALRTCRDTLDGLQSGSSCRRAFVKAARVARITAPQRAKASPPCIRSHDLRGGLPD
jgi:hypothetical protein